MGTRADFYIGGTDPASMRWLGSVAWDGYPDGMPEILRRALDEDTYVVAVAAVLATRPDATIPEQGWPWPWGDSRTTDYAYTWDGERVVASCFGSEWWPAWGEEPDPMIRNAQFPDMTAVQKIAWDQRSGLMFVQAEVRDE